MATQNVAALLESERRVICLHKAYILAAFIITLTFGSTWGVINLVRIVHQRFFSGPEYAGTQAHGHAQIFGWVALFIMGVAFYTFPRFQHKRLGSLAPAWSVLVLLFLGVLLRSVAQPLATNSPWNELLVCSALLELAAVALFVGHLLWVRLTSRGPRLLLEPLVFAGLLALLSATVWNAWLCALLADRHATVVPEPANSHFVFLAVLGFIANMILGYSLRFLPILLGVSRARPAPVLIAFALFNGGILARRAGWEAASGPAVFLASVIYSFALHVFERPATQVKSRGVDLSFPWFVRVGYLWFVVATAMIAAGDLFVWRTGQPLPHAFIGAYRHALTVGFVTSMMLGLGHRLLPAFAGVHLYRLGWMRTCFVLIVVGNLLRVSFELATLSGRPGTFFVMGSSGFLELAAIGLFALNIFESFRQRPVYVFAPEQINPATRAQWLLGVFTPAREILERAGVRQIDEIAPTITLESLATDQGLPLDDLLETLRREIDSARRNH